MTKLGAALQSALQQSSSSQSSPSLVMAPTPFTASYTSNSKLAADALYMDMPSANTSQQHMK
eukprot:6385454-Karenia_brevis.AAC.1